jgi:hypothetical protein
VASRFPDKQGTVLTQNNWLRSWSNDLYLWYNEIVDRDPSLYTTPEYFDLLKTTATTASGKPKDQFHFTMLTSDFEDSRSRARAQAMAPPGRSSRRGRRVRSWWRIPIQVLRRSIRR